MPKKTTQAAEQAPAAAPAAATLPAYDPAVPLALNEAGYGALPCVWHGADDHGRLVCTADELANTMLALADQKLEVQVLKLREWCAARPDDDVAESVLQWFLAEGVVSDWLPVADDNGFELIAKLLLVGGEPDAEPDAVAVFVRQTAKTEEPADANQADAAQFLIGNLMAAAKRHFIGLAVPWRELNEHEQGRILRMLADDVRAAAGKAVRAIASNQRLTFRAEVESVQFKGASDIKAALKLSAGPESHALADAAGGFVTVVIENVDELLAIPDAATKGDADQKPLFDSAD